MNYEVAFSVAADSQMLKLWLRAREPEKVMDAIDDVTRLLSESPEDLGESRGTLSDRIWFHSPFAVLFRIEENAQLVRVAELRWIGF